MEKNRFVPNVKYFPFISADINIMNVSSVRLSRIVDKNLHILINLEFF